MAEKRGGAEHSSSRERVNGKKNNVSIKAIIIMTIGLRNVEGKEWRELGKVSHASHSTCTRGHTILPPVVRTFPKGIKTSTRIAEAQCGGYCFPTRFVADPSNDFYCIMRCNYKT